MYRLDRKTLEIIYKSFFRPVLEYGDILMSNITEEQSALIEQVHKRAGSIISGAIRGTSSAVLYEELSWISMEMRRKQRRLLAFHKIIHNIAPQYLRNCLPPTVRDNAAYNFRNLDALRTIPTRLELFYKSFFPLTVREWNVLPLEVRNINDHEQFKTTLQKELPVPNPLYSYGKRKLNIIHSRIRMGCSSLNAHLYRHHVLDTPQCACGDPYEDQFHYLCACPRYIIERNALQNAVSIITNCSIRTLLYGSESCNLEQNKQIFHYVHNFIESTARFK